MERLKNLFFMAAFVGAFPAGAQENTGDLTGNGDPVFEHETELEDLQRRLEVASMRFLIASEIAKIAEEESKTAVSQAAGAEQRRLKSISEATARQSNPGRISMVTARLTTGAGRAELCDLKWYLAYKCNGLPECAVEMNSNACGGTSGNAEPIDLTVQYACGKPEDPEYETRRGEFRYRDLQKPGTAYLTCY